jgi:hypothetical protein
MFSGLARKSMWNIFILSGRKQEEERKTFRNQAGKMVS